MRKPAAEMLDALPEIAEANGRWNEGLMDDVEDLQVRWGGLEIGDYEIERTAAADVGWFWGLLGYKSQPSTAVGIVEPPGARNLYFKFIDMMSATLKDRTLVAPETPDGKLVAYLLGLAPNPRPRGWADLGSINLASGELEGRPAFASSITAEMEGRPGMARRHITAWHNLKRLLNTVIEQGGIGLLRTLLGQRDPKDALMVQGNDLVRKANAWAKGGFADHDARDVLVAAFVMHNQRRNLWSGPRRENSEIAVFSAAVQRYADEYMRGARTRRELCDAIASYRTRSAKAKEAQFRLAKELATMRAERSADVVGVVHRALKSLEVDLPPAGLADEEERIHDDLYGLLYMGAQLPPGRVEEILAFFLTGRLPEPESSCAIM